MTDGCPPECKVQLDGISNQIQELKGTDLKQWEVFDQKISTLENQMLDRAKTKTLIAVFGVIVTLFLAIMALTFNQLHSGQQNAVLKLDKIDNSHTEQMMKIQKEVTEIGTKLEERTKDTDG